MPEGRSKLPGLRPDAEVALARRLETLERRLQALESTPAQPPIVQEDTFAREGQYLRLQPRATGLTVTLPEARPANRGKRITLGFENANPVTIRAVSGLVNSESRVINNVTGTYDAVSDGENGWNVATGVSSSGSAYTWAEVLAAGALSGASNPLIDAGQYIGVDEAGDGDFTGLTGNVRANAGWRLNVDANNDSNIQSAIDVGTASTNGILLFSESTVVANGEANGVLLQDDGTTRVQVANGGVTLTPSSTDWVHVAEGHFRIAERTSLGATVGAGNGAYWVKDDAPNIAKFTDDAGTDWNLVQTIQEVLAKGNQVTSGTVLRFDGAGDQDYTGLSGEIQGNAGLFLSGQTAAGSVSTFELGTAGSNWAEVNAPFFVVNLGASGYQLLDPGFLIMTEQSASSPVVSAGRGMLWVGDDAPSTPRFTDDTNVDHRLAYEEQTPTLRRARVFDDFWSVYFDSTNGLLHADTLWRVDSSATPTITYYDNSSLTNDGREHVGAVQIVTAGTDDDHVCIHKGSAPDDLVIAMDASVEKMECVFRMADSSVAFQFGVSRDISSFTHSSNHAIAVVDTDAYGDMEVHFLTGDSGGNQESTATGVVLVDSQWYKITIRRSGDNWELLIDDASEATHSTDIPDDSSQVAGCFGACLATRMTGTRGLRIDSLECTSREFTDRT